MRKEERVESTIGKIQKNFMRYTQLKVNGLKTLMATTSGSDRDRSNQTELNIKKKKSSSKFKMNDEGFDSSFNHFNSTAHYPKRKNKNKSSMSFTGKLMMIDDKRVKGVGFEGHHSSHFGTSKRY